MYLYYNKYDYIFSMLILPNSLNSLLNKCLSYICSCLEQFNLMIAQL